MNIWDSSGWTPRQRRGFRVVIASVCVLVLIVVVALVWGLSAWWTHFAVG